MFGRGGEEAAPTGAPEGLILVLFTVLTLAASAYVLAGAERDAERSPAGQAARPAIQGLDQSSLLREQNLRRVLTRVAAGPRPLVTYIRVAPARVDLTVRDRAGSRTEMSVDPSFKATETGFGAGTDDALRASALDPRGPERMARAVARRTGLGLGAVDYVTLKPIGLGEPTWYLFLKSGPPRTRQWAAALDGSDLRYPGDPSKRERRHR